VHIELQFDGVITARSFTLSNPDRLVLDLTGVNPQVRPEVTIPTNQSALIGLAYDTAPHGGLRVVLQLAEGVLGDVQSPAPDILIAELRVPAAEAPQQPAPPLTAEPATPMRQKVRIGFEKNRAVLSFDAPFEYSELRLDNPPRFVVDIPDIDVITAYDAKSPLDGVRELRHSLSAEDGRLRLVFEIKPGTQANVERGSPRTLHIRFAKSGIPVAEPPPTVQRTLQTTSPRQRAEQAYADGIRLLTEGKRAQAEAKFRIALGHDASLHDARLTLANALLAQGRVREAEVQLQEGLRIAPGEAQLAERYARLLVDRGDLSGAIGVLSAAPPPIELEPLYHALLAALLQRAGHHKAAAETYTALVDVKPKQGLWWAGLGISLEALRRPDAALGAYRRAAQDPRLSTEMARFVNERVAALHHLDKEWEKTNNG
jgi:Tfp pilus assembly protein PilF